VYFYQFFATGADHESLCPPFLFYRLSAQRFKKAPASYELFKPSTFGSAAKMAKKADQPGSRHVLLVRSELCYPVATPLDIWHAKNKKKVQKSALPQDGIFLSHRRVFLTDEDHAGIRKSVYDYDKSSLPSPERLKRAMKSRPS
jgi:hypothetical protein